MEGPQFSSRAESLVYRQLGFDVIGMTNMPEAKLAREAEIPYATVAMVTDFDCWHEEEGPVDVEQILACMHDNVADARRLILKLVESLPASRAASPIDTATRGAIISAPGARDPKTLARLATLIGREPD